MPYVVTLGEVMLRLKSPANERLFQSPVLEATFGGAEANVAVSLAQFGMDARFVSAIPANAVGDSCVAALRAFGVDTGTIRRQGDRLGIYFLETGAAQRPSRVVYDRAGSGIAMLRANDVNWDAAFAGADWFHISGVTPAISAHAAELSLTAATEARARGLRVSCDYNFRKNLWKYGKKAPEVMRDLVALADVGIANEEDCQYALGIQLDGNSADAKGKREAYRRLAEKVLAAFPNLESQTITLRESFSADHNGWSAVMHNRKDFLSSKRYEIHDIVDRVGAGDSFAAGLIYGLRALGDDQQAIEFAAAASCLKHSIPGDFNRISVAEVNALVGGDASGRVQR